MICREPAPRLRPFVSLLWASVAGPATASRELVLPTGAAHVAIRTEEVPVRLFRDRFDEAGSDVGVAVIGGPRSRAYVKDVSTPCGCVGASLRPGAVHHLCRQDAAALAERHAPLDAFWPTGAELVERVQEERDAGRRIDLLESFLLDRFPEARCLHPAIARSLERLAGDARVAEVVRSSGYSHRGFLTRFRREVGLAPKRYGRVARFRRALTLLGQGRSLVATALGAGYADQPHFTREFRELAGIPPGEYAGIAPAREYHVPVPEVQFRSRPAPRSLA